MKMLLSLLLPVAAFAQLPPTREEAQIKFDSAVNAADAATAELISHDGSKELLLPVWGAGSEEEIRALSLYVRLSIPAPGKDSVDGQEILVYEGFRPGYRGGFLVTLRKKNEVLLTFTVFDGETIGSKMLLDYSAIRVRKESFAPFFEKLLSAAKERASQASEPTSGLTPSRGSP